MTTVVLVTGAKSGIGKGLLAAYAARPNHIAIAAIRDGPDTAIAKTLEGLPTGKGSRVIVAKYDASNQNAATELVTYLQQKHSISYFDVVIANAGILKQFGPASQVTTEEMLEHFQINTLGPLRLYQASAPYLNASTATPKFFVISSTLGSNGLMDSYPMPLVAYGTSKAAINFIFGKIHREEKRIVAVPVQPGWVQTNLGEKAAEMTGRSKSDIPITLDDSVNGLLKIFDTANKEEHSGKFFDQTFSFLPW